MHLDRSVLADLSIFVTVVRRQSIKQAANEIGVTSSAVSHRLRKLEADLGVRLLNRTSRSLTPTDAGVELAGQIEAGLRTIGDALGALAEQREFPMGKVRLNLLRDAARILLAPVLPQYASLYPGMQLDLVADDKMVDIVAEGFDAGIRYGDRVPQDMIGAALSGPLQWVVVGAPALIARVGRPSAPEDLRNLPCIEMLLGNNRRYVWELGNDASRRLVEVKGPLCVNDTEQVIEAALSGMGYAYCLEPMVRRHIVEGALEIVLPEWACQGSPFTMYYPSRRQVPAGLRRLIDLIRIDQGLPRLAMSTKADSEAVSGLIA